jgi:hypothetical protein
MRNVSTQLRTGSHQVPREACSAGRLSYNCLWLSHGTRLRSQDSIMTEPRSDPPNPGHKGAIGRHRAKRGRIITFGLVVSSLAILVIWIWGVRNVDGLPDVGDPFDITAARQPIDIADSDNAYVLYVEAKGAMSKRPAALSGVDFHELTWEKAGDDVRVFVQNNRPALEIWREGSDRPAAIYNQPGNLAVDTLLPVIQEVAPLASLAGLEGSRHEHEGAMDQAWNWYRAMLRSSRHFGMHGVLVERMIGAGQHKGAARHIMRWAADPRVDANLLRKALDDTLIADAMTPRMSETLKLEYLMYLRDLEEMRVMVQDIPMPGGRFGVLEQMVAATGAKAPIQRFCLRASNDVERSRRATRLLFANWLAQVDKPETDRAPIAISKPTLIYATDPTAPPAARAVDPEILNLAIDHAALAHEMFRPAAFSSVNGTPMSRAPWEGDGSLAQETRNRAALIVKLAAELFRREHNKPPATAGALVGTYLEVLPEGIDREQPVPGRIE